MGTRWRQSNPEKVLLSSAKSRARKKSLSFDLEVGDIKIPEVCPVLGIFLEKDVGGIPGPASPSIDRINPALGYVEGNVRVISWRANNLRRDATAEELKLVAEDAARLVAT